jgi:hypothetical protein
MQIPDCEKPAERPDGARPRMLFDANSFHAPSSRMTDARANYRRSQRCLLHSWNFPREALKLLTTKF